MRDHASAVLRGTPTIERATFAGTKSLRACWCAERQGRKYVSEDASPCIAHEEARDLGCTGPGFFRFGTAQERDGSMTGQGSTERVMLELEEEIMLENGIRLPPGVYAATKSRSWIGAEYRLELSAEDVRALAGPKIRAMQSDFDVSSFVRRGKIRVF